MREMESMTGSLVNKYTDTHTETGQKEKQTEEMDRVDRLAANRQSD